MKRHELKRILDGRGVNECTYSLHGGLANDCGHFLHMTEMQLPGRSR